MKRGWCPTLYYPMPSGDGLLVRVKPHAARLTPDAARTLAAAATRFGNGIIELTQRGNLQLRGLTPASASAFAAAMVEAGLAHPDPAQEARRAVMPPPLLGDDPGMDPAAAAFTANLEHAFATDPRLAGLPPKFAIAVDAGGVLAARPVAADLVAWIDGPNRVLRPATRGTARAPVGWLPYPGTDDGAFGLAPPFGQMDAALLLHAAALAEHFGTALRITPWRALLLGRLPLHTPIEAPGWITHPDDPRLWITACIGSPGCATAEAPARQDAARLRPTAPLHLSGCAKGCAHPGPAATVLVGRAGRYDLVRNGRARDLPVAAGLTLDDAARPAMTRTYERDGAAIYRQSFATIRAETDLSPFTHDEARIVVRLVHACGMPEIASAVRFHPAFATAARNALLAGAPILCDAKMVAHGITRPRLPAANPVLCTLDDPATPPLARQIGNTRSAAALELWGERLHGALVVIGNAPTALFHLLDLLDAGAPPPAAIIGLPVGFVGAAESKEALAEAAPVPWMIVEGRRGGSAMAVAAVNALASETE